MANKNIANTDTDMEMIKIMPKYDPSRLAQAIYIYSNYEKLEKEAEEKDMCMKESRDFYMFRIANALEQIFDGKSEEEIKKMIVHLIC